jgi:hypothetical protein
MSKQNLSAFETPQYKQLLNDVVQLIQQGRQRVAIEINSTVVLLYWAIGKRINDEMLLDKRAEYGDQIIEGVSV